MNYLPIAILVLLLVSCKPEANPKAVAQFRKNYKEHLHSTEKDRKPLVGTGMLLEFTSLTADDIVRQIAAAHEQLFPERKGNKEDLEAIRKLLQDKAPALCAVTMKDSIPDFMPGDLLLLENYSYFCSVEFGRSVYYELSFYVGDVLSLNPDVQICRSHTDGDLKTSVTTQYYSRKQIVYLYIRITGDDLPAMAISLSDTANIYSASPDVNKHFLSKNKR